MSTIGKTLILIALIGSLLAACTSHPTATPIPVPPQGNNPYAPQPDDEALTRGDAEIVSTSVLKAESFPPQVSVSLAYRLPTPCFQLRVSISQPDNQNRIQVEVYGVTPKDTPCNLMALLTPLETNISLGSFLAGHYSVWVNGQQAGEFDTK
jgi:hypothetical protein